jgi:hypothetical protein
VYLAGVGVLMLLLLVRVGATTGRRQHLDRRELKRVTRLADQLRREQTWPFD